MVTVSNILEEFFINFFCIVFGQPPILKPNVESSTVATNPNGQQLAETNGITKLPLTIPTTGAQPIGNQPTKTELNSSLKIRGQVNPNIQPKPRQLG